MDESESRVLTVITGCVAFGSVLLFVAVYAPALADVGPSPPGIRPLSPLPLIAAMLGFGGWIPCIGIGINQLIHRRRTHGLISIGFGVIQVAAFQTAEWLLMESRGIYWGS